MLSARPAGLPLDLDRGISTKTPGRALTKTRNDLQENAVRNAPMTVGKGRKMVQNTPLQSKTLKTDRILNEPPTKQAGPYKSKETLAIRPLGDKTPFPNRTANQLPASGAKIAKPALPDGSLRPSSARKHERLPRSAGKVFETPITNGKHWDVSDIEIEVDVPAANQSIEEESFDEIEYMPPRVEDVPYEPPFEMPDYREVGKTLMALIRSYTLEDDSPNNDMTFVADASENNFFKPPSLPQQEIEDDSPFARAKPEPEPKLRPSTTSKQRHDNANTTASKPIPRPTVQRTMSGTRPTALAKPRVTPAVRRSPDTSNARPPTTAARKSISQPVTRAPTSQSTVRAPIPRATTRAVSTPPVHASTARPSRVPSVSRPTIKPAVRPTVPTATARGKPAPVQPSVPTARNRAFSDAPLSMTTRPRSGTITKAAFEANTHVVVHIRNNSLEDVKKDLEGLVVFDDAFDDEDGFRFEV